MHKAAPQRPDESDEAYARRLAHNAVELEKYRAERDKINAARRERYKNDATYRAYKNEAQRKQRERNGRNRRADSSYALKAKYGITMDDYERMLADQEGVCAACSAPPGKRRLHVDHRHDNGVVRGLLCFSCNTVLGHVGDDPDRLIALAAYLIRSETLLRVTKE